MASDLLSTLRSLFPPPPDPQGAAWKVGLIPFLLVLLPLAVAWWRMRRSGAPAGGKSGKKQAKASGPVWVAPLAVAGALFAAEVAMRGWPRELVPVHVGNRFWLATALAAGFGFLDAWLPARWFATLLPRAVGAALVGALFLEPSLHGKVSALAYWTIIGAVGVFGGLAIGAADAGLRTSPGAGGPFALLAPGLLASLALFHSAFSATAETCGALVSAALAAVLVGLVVRSLRLDRGGATAIGLIYLAMGTLVGAWSQLDGGWARFVVGGLLAATPAALALAQLPLIAKWPMVGRYAVRVAAPALTAGSAMLIAWLQTPKSGLY